jgi:hypothetical protein
MNCKTKHLFPTVRHLDGFQGPLNCHGDGSWHVCKVALRLLSPTYFMISYMFVEFNSIMKVWVKKKNKFVSTKFEKKILCSQSWSSQVGITSGIHFLLNVDDELEPLYSMSLSSICLTIYCTFNFTTRSWSFFHIYLLWSYACHQPKKS